MWASYDEELTPAIDPPLIEPPPRATLIGRIFAHRRPGPTVVEVPLVPMVTPPVPSAGPVPGLVTSEPPGEPAWPNDTEATGVDGAAAPGVADGTRYCRACGDRVPVGPDGTRCTAGHRLSPAHKRRWWAFWRRR